jgi:beta-galactosidase
MEVEEYDSLPPGATRGLRFLHAGFRAGTGKHQACWCEVLHLRGAEPLAVYTDGHYRGRTAVTLNRLDAGQVIYLGVAAEQPLYDALVPGLCRLAGVQPVLRTPPGVEAAERSHGDRRILFLLNHGDRPRRMRLGQGRFTDLVGGGCLHRGRVTLPPFGVRVLDRTVG